MFSGVNKLCYSGGRHWPHEVISLTDPSDQKQAAIFKWLERVVHIVDIPFVSRPQGYSCNAPHGRHAFCASHPPRI